MPPSDALLQNFLYCAIAYFSGKPLFLYLFVYICNYLQSTMLLFTLIYFYFAHDFASLSFLIPKHRQLASSATVS